MNNIVILKTLLFMFLPFVSVCMSFACAIICDYIVDIFEKQ